MREKSQYFYVNVYFSFSSFLRGLEGPHLKELPLRYLFIDKVFFFC